MAEVKLEGMTKRFGDKVAISDMSWTANQGEFVVVFGPSGAGKTTTLKLIAGLEMPDEGDVYFNGMPMREVDTADRDVAMAFENYALYPHMSVFDNIAFPMMVPGRSEKYSKEQIKQRVTEIAAVLQIEMLLHRPPQQLSGGQRQRVALGRCLIREPEVCLLDEPIAHLDAKLRHRMYAELKRIQRSRGTTTIYATPAQTEAMALADRIVVIFEGELQQIGTPREVYEHPATVSIAKFGGEQTMNIIPAEVSVENGSMWLALGGHRIPAPAQLRSALEERQASKDILLGVRPPDILCAPAELEGALPAEVYASEHFGHAMLLSVKLGDELIEVVTKNAVDFRVGEQVWLSFMSSRLYAFDAATAHLLAATPAQEPTIAGC